MARTGLGLGIVLERLSAMATYLFRNRKTGERYSLRQIPTGPARRNEALPSCSFFCEMAEMEYAA